MLDMYPPDKRGSVMAIWGMGVMLGPILGPTLGGYLTDAYNWRWVFYINVPFGIAAVTGIWLFFEDTHRDYDAEIRLVRLRRCRSAWRAAADARPRHRQGLVLLARDRDRGGDRRHRALSLPRPHADGEEDLSSRKQIFKDRNFVSSLVADVRDGSGAAGELGADLALSAESRRVRSPRPAF